MRRFLLAALIPAAALILVGLIALALVAFGRGGNGRAPVPSQSAGNGASLSGLPRLAPEGSVCQGLLRRPDPSQPRTFAAEYTKRAEAAGIVIIDNGDVSDEALEIARQTVERVFRNNDLEAPLAEEGAYVIVAASYQGVLDLPEFACLQDEVGDDFFSHVCGVADRADYPVATVNELDLLGDRTGPCDGLNILFHELGHLVQGWALPPADYYDVRQYYQDSLNDGRYAGMYAATNAFEYFAEATQAYFHDAEPRGGRGRVWLQHYDPAVFDLLARVYGG